MNIDSFFHVTTAALAHLPAGAAIINTSAINGLRGKNTLMDYAATKCGCPRPRADSLNASTQTSSKVLAEAGSVALGMGMHAALGAAGGAAVAGAQGLGRRLRSGNQSTPWEQLDAATNDARGVHGAPQPGYEPVPNPGDGPDSAGPAGAAGDGPSGGGGGGGTAGATAVPTGEAIGQLAASATPTGVAPILDQFIGGRAKQPAKSGRGQNNPAAGAAGLDNASAPQRDRPAAAPDADAPAVPPISFVADSRYSGAVPLPEPPPPDDEPPPPPEHDGPTPSGPTTVNPITEK